MKLVFRPMVLFLTFLASALAAWSQSTGAVPVPAPTAPESVQEVKDDRYRIGLRDKLSVQVYRHPDLTQTVTVNPNGTISLFRLDDPIVALCKTERELANDIAAAYARDYLRNPEVQVSASEQNSQSVAVMGAVERGGTFFISRPVRLMELIALAGGPKKEAGSRLIVARTGSNTNCREDDATASSASPSDADQDLDKTGYFSMTLKDIQEGRQNMAMRPGDVVWMLPADVVFVYGNVNEQGKVEMREPITLMQAIASAKGLKAASDKGKVRVIRQNADGTDPQVFSYDLGAIAKQKATDPFLQPNDIVAVSEDKTKSILLNIRNSMTQGIPGLFYRIQ